MIEKKLLSAMQLFLTFKVQACFVLFREFNALENFFFGNTGISGLPFSIAMVFAREDLIEKERASVMKDFTSILLTWVFFFFIGPY